MLAPQSCKRRAGPGAGPPASGPEISMDIDPDRLPSPADRRKADEAVERIVKAAGDTGNTGYSLSKDERALIEAMAGNSPFLARLIDRHADYLLGILAGSPDDSLEAQLSDLEIEGGKAESAEALMRTLRLSRGRLALLIAAADIAGGWPLESICKALSRFADLAVSLALARALHARMSRGELAWPDGADAPPTPDLSAECGLFVLGLGKLGAYELNYSSDIDLIVLYDEEAARYNGKGSLPDCMVRVTQDMVRILETRTADGFVFRTDLRLRPDPGATPVALSVDAAETYYQSIALNWERAAMIKARVIAGDREAGDAYLKRLSPFIWRHSLDYAAIEDIHAIKDRIHRHHKHRDDGLAGFDVKLGRGGIREIEFFAQIQQLILGGRNPELRCPATLAALEVLVSLHRLSPAARDSLGEAYRFLRTVEHRLQMIDDAQTHSLPKDPDALERAALFCGYDSVEAFHAALSTRLDVVRRQYDGLLPEGRNGGRTVMDETTLRDSLARHGYGDLDSACSIVERWRRGRYRALRSDRARRLMEDTLPMMIEGFAQAPSPDRALARFDGFLERLPAGVQLFALFQSNPSLFTLIGRIMGIAPALADTLARRPHLVDALLEPDFFAPLPEAGALAAELDDVLARARDYQDVLDFARRWVDELRFRIGVQTLETVAGTEEAVEAMTRLADVAIPALLTAAQSEYAGRHGRFPGGALAVVAMGKYGGRELSFGSDLDLVLLYHAEAEATESDGPKPLGPARYFNGLGQALIAAIDSLTSEGRLWEVDTRLRPSGQSGPLVVTVERFAEYQEEAAWTWEHMALTRARVIAGPAPVQHGIETAIRTTLTRHRRDASLLPAVDRMRQRLRDEFGTDNAWAVKHVRGGLVDIEFVTQYLLLREGARQPDIFTPRIDDCLDSLVAALALRKDQGETLKQGYRLQQSVQSILRLTLTGEPDADSFVPELKSVLCRVAKEESFEALDRRLKTLQTDCHAIYESVIAGPAGSLHRRDLPPDA